MPATARQRFGPRRPSKCCFSALLVALWIISNYYRKFFDMKYSPESMANGRTATSYYLSSPSCFIMVSVSGKPTHLLCTMSLPIAIVKSLKNVFKYRAYEYFKQEKIRTWVQDCFSAFSSLSCFFRCLLNLTGSSFSLVKSHVLPIEKKLFMFLRKILVCCSPVWCRHTEHSGFRNIFKLRNTQSSFQTS